MNIPTIEQLTPAMLSAVAGAIISLVFRFVPGAKDWYDKLGAEQKQLYMLLIVVGVATLIGAYNYMQAAALGTAHVTWSSLLYLLFTVYTAATANQVTYLFVKPAK